MKNPDELLLKSLINLRMLSERDYERLLSALQSQYQEHVDALLQASDKDTIYKHQLLANTYKDIADTLARPSEILKELDEQAT